MTEENAVEAAREFDAEGFEAEYRDSIQDIVLGGGNGAKLRRLFRDFEAWVRADERAKWDAVKQGYIDAAATIENEFRAFRENLETFVDERSKAQGDSALRAAAREVVDWLLFVGVTEGHESQVLLLSKLQAALDGTPREPLVEEVERAAEALWLSLWGGEVPPGQAYEHANPENWERHARAALKAAWGGG